MKRGCVHTIFMALRQYFWGTYHVSVHEGYINYNNFSDYSSGDVDNFFDNNSQILSAVMSAEDLK